ncbi:MAG TPA: TetR family transcriptional regulator [Caulobacteraceae bacterium]|nr:TetR family transcriptional regulator [Caulobacteraceae bacterium]
MAIDITAEPRRRNAAATRAAILFSARKAFAAHGYDGVGVRDIAAGAGVTAVLVNRYFGSKEKLFIEAAAQALKDPVVLAPENLAAPDLASALARAIVKVTAPGETPLDGFLILLHSAASPQAAEIGRVWLERVQAPTLTASLDGPLTAERAAVFGALVCGIQVMRQIFETPALARASPADLERILVPMIQALTDPRS